MAIGHRATELIQVCIYETFTRTMADHRSQIEIAFQCMAWVAIALRLYVRTFIVKAFGWDDGWMLFAQLMHTMNSTCAIGGALTGTGRLMKDLTPGGMMMALRVGDPVESPYQILFDTDLLNLVLVDLLLLILSMYDRC